MMDANSSHPAARPRRTRAVYSIAGSVILAGVCVRELTFRAGKPSFVPCILLLAGVALMTMTGPWLLRRYRWYPYVYFPAMTALVQALGWLPPYQDVWGLLYLHAGVQSRLYLRQREMLAWAAISAAIGFATFIVTFGPLAGLGHALTYLAGAIMLVSWDALSCQARSSREASQALLAELQDAHARLQAYADDIEERAALRERDRMAHQLHDSVSQMLFSITLGAESARMLLARDPERVPAQLERLEELTAGALRQMRSLITEWRPG